jgi:hypothetical protein
LWRLKEIQQACKLLSAVAWLDKIKPHLERIRRAETTDD